MILINYHLSDLGHYIGFISINFNLYETYLLIITNIRKYLQTHTIVFMIYIKVRERYVITVLIIFIFTSLNFRLNTADKLNKNIQLCRICVHNIYFLKFIVSICYNCRLRFLLFKL